MDQMRQVDKIGMRGVLRDHALNECAKQLTLQRYSFFRNDLSRDFLAALFLAWWY